MIGKGAFGRVLLATKRTGSERGRAFAVKVLDKEVVKQTGQAAHTRAERQTLASLRHPFVVRLRYAFQSKARLYLVTDFYAGGSLERHLDDAHPVGLGPARTLFYAAELVAALRHCHAAGVVHRDLKPGNVLLDARGHVGLTDFGLCALGVHEDGAPLRSFCGTVTYMAPELLVGHAYGTSVDWWALGALTFEIASGRPPFEDANRRRMFYAILHLPPPFPLDFSNELIEFLSGLLEKRPERRLGVRRAGPGEDDSKIAGGVQADAAAPTKPDRRLFPRILARAKAAAPSPPPDGSTVGVAAASDAEEAPLNTSDDASDADAYALGRGGDEIKRQPYFAEIDWTALCAKSAAPPWVPALASAHDVSYVPRRVTDRRAASIRDEFHDSDVGGKNSAGEARISRQTASLTLDADTSDAAAVRALRRNNPWADFSFAAPPRGGTVAEAKPSMVAKPPSHEKVPKPPPRPPPDLVSEEL